MTTHQLQRRLRCRLSHAVSILLMATAFVMLSAHVQAAEELRILTWEGLANDTWVKPFEKKYDVKIKRTYVGSNDEYMAKLAAGDTQYDMVVIVSSLAQPAIKAGFVEPVDLDMIPNFKQLYPTFQKLDFLRSDGEQYGVPNDWDILPVTVNADIVKNCSFNVLFDPKYKGKISMWDDVATLGTVAAYMGYDNIWTLTDDQLAQVKQKMIEQKPLIRTYWSTGGEIAQLFASGEVVATNSWSYVTQQLQDEGLNAKQCTPKNPTAFLDANFVVKGTTHRKLVQKFINYLISPKVMAQVYSYSGFGVPNPGAAQYLPDDAFEGSIMSKGPDFRKRINFWQEIPRRGKYLEVWNQIKAAPVR